jgi:hypothetical protein
MLTNTLVQTFYSNRIFDFKEKIFFHFGVDVRQGQTISHVFELVCVEIFMQKNVKKKNLASGKNFFSIVYKFRTQLYRKLFLNSQKISGETLK